MALCLQRPKLVRNLLLLLLLLQAEAPIPRERLDAMIDGNIQLAQELRIARTRVGCCSRTATCMQASGTMINKHSESLVLEDP